MAQIRMVLIAIVVLVMGGIGFMQYSAMKGVEAAIDGADAGGAQYDDYEAPKNYSSNSGGSLIKSTKTSTRVGGDKTITIQRKAPGLWMRIRMFFGYEPEDAHRRDFARLKAQREREAAYSKGVNQATGRKESTANRRSTAAGGKRQAAPNRSLAGALSGN